MVDHLLIGGGIASATCAAELRALGADGSIVVVGREPGAPYHRPPVTKGYLGGAQLREDTLIHPDGWWEQNGVELLTRTSVLALDLDARVATLSTKEQIRFGQALVATGAMVRRLTVAGSELEGIHYLRALGNADALRRDVEDATRVVLIGGSYIGCEVAATLTTMGKRCTMVMPEAHPLERGFGMAAGGFFRQVLEDHGVEIFAGEQLDRYEGEDGRVRAVQTTSGRELAADAVVVGVGSLPDTTLARKAGLEIGETGGVRCDARLRTSAPDVFAAGDMCEYSSVVHGRRLRIEHEDAAAEQGRTVARNMQGHQQFHRAAPYFFSDLADWVSIEYVGPAIRWDEEVMRGSFEERRFTLWYLHEGRSAGMLAVHDPASEPLGARGDAPGCSAPLRDTDSVKAA